MKSMTTEKVRALLTEHASKADSWFIAEYIGEFLHQEGDDGWRRNFNDAPTPSIAILDDFRLYTAAIVADLFKKFGRPEMYSEHGDVPHFRLTHNDVVVTANCTFRFAFAIDDNNDDSYTIVYRKDDWQEFWKGEYVDYIQEDMAQFGVSRRDDEEHVAECETYENADIQGMFALLFYAGARVFEIVTPVAE